MERTKWPSPPTRLQLQRHTLGGGEVCSLPIRYFDARCLIATFRTDLDRATALLKGVGLDAVADGDGRATVLFGCFEYRDTDLGPYNEVGLGVLSRANGDRDPALYVLHLPVTTAKTDWIGRELWGYPKFVAAIILRGDDKAFSTTLSEAATGTIAVFEGGFGPAVPSPPCDLPTYSVLDSQGSANPDTGPHAFPGGRRDGLLADGGGVASPHGEKPRRPRFGWREADLGEIRRSLPGIPLSRLRRLIAYDRDLKSPRHRVGAARSASVDSSPRASSTSASSENGGSASRAAERISRASLARASPR